MQLPDERAETLTMQLLASIYVVRYIHTTSNSVRSIRTTYNSVCSTPKRLQQVIVCTRTQCMHTDKVGTNNKKSYLLSLGAIMLTRMQTTKYIVQLIAGFFACQNHGKESFLSRQHVVMQFKLLPLLGTYHGSKRSLEVKKAIGQVAMACKYGLQTAAKGYFFVIFA